MWLLDVKTYKLRFFEAAAAVPRYAILSHTWADGEVLFKDISVDGWTNRKGALKIRYTCKQASTDGFEYVWIDTCCIDKSSSAELSEAINSMFEWYRHSAVCYVYLQDATAPALPNSTGSPENLRSHYRWWLRGWTLQELIAPKDVVFYNRAWRYLTTRELAAHKI